MISLVSNLSYNDTKLSHDRSWYHEQSNGSTNLIITAGDSWTWGDSLGGINLSNGLRDNYEYRTTHIYGHQIAKSLNADWINIGVVGGANAWILRILFEKILKNLARKYDNIVVVITLTELCRELGFDSAHFVKNIDHNNWSFNTFLELYEKNMFLYIKENMELYPSVTFKIGRNFTYSYDNNKTILKNYHFNKTWVDVIAEETNQEQYPQNCRFISQMAQNPIIQYLKSQKLLNQSKVELSTLMIDSLDAVDWLANSPMNYKQGTGHPSDEGHTAWAEYIIKNL